MNYLLLFIFLFSTVVYVFSIIHYKNMLNPLGVFTFIWGCIPYLYSLRLSPLLIELNPVTYLVCYVSLFFFVMGCLIKTKRKYIKIYNYVCINQKKLYCLYFFFFVLCFIEIIIQTPPLLSKNPFAAYVNPDGIGLRFFHLATYLLPIMYIIIFNERKISLKIKFLLFFPPFIFILLWLQRGMLMWFFLSIITLFISNKLFIQQIKIIILSICVIIFGFNIIGNYRTSFDTSNNSISKISKMGHTASFAVWPYIYTTTSLMNIDQTLTNYEDITYRYGFDVVKPVLSIFQIKFLEKVIFPDYPGYYKVKSGFNVPTYLYWIFINFGFGGFIFVPFLLGYISQSLFNMMNSGLAIQTIIYAIWFPSLVESVHDFLFWKFEFVLAVIFIVVVYKKIRVGSLSIGRH